MHQESFSTFAPLSLFLMKFIPEIPWSYHVVEGLSLRGCPGMGNGFSTDSHDLIHANVIYTPHLHLRTPCICANVHKPTHTERKRVVLHSEDIRAL